MPRYTVSPVVGGGSTPVVFGAWDLTSAPAPSTRDQIFIGRLNESGARRPVFFDVTRETVVALFGKRGSGKSYSLGVLAESLCTAEHESSIGVLTRSRAVLLFDTLNVFWSTANPFDEKRDGSRFEKEMRELERWEVHVPELNVMVWVPKGTTSAALPPLYRDFTIAISALSADDTQDLMGLDPAGPSGQLISDALSIAKRVREDFDFEDVLKVVEDSEELGDYAENTRRAVRQRLRFFASNPVFARDGTPLIELLVPGSLSVMELGELEETQRTTISAVLLRQIHRVRQEAATLEKQLALNTRLTEVQQSAIRDRLNDLVPPSWIMVDEAQTVFPSDRTTRATDAFVRFVKEGRNFGLSFALTTQQPSAVDQRVLSQVDTVICHQLTVEADINRLKDNMKSGLPNEVAVSGRKLDLSGWLRSLDPGEAIVSNSDYDRAFSVEIRPRVCPHAGSGFTYASLPEK